MSSKKSNFVIRILNKLVIRNSDSSAQVVPIHNPFVMTSNSIRFLFLVISLSISVSCKKDNSDPDPEPPVDLTGTVTDINGNIYNTIKIGTQTWMSENLRTVNYSNGDTIPHVTDDSQWGSLTNGAWCHYENNFQYLNPYGNLYNWYTVADPRNVCPTGWHVPDDDDWNKLVKYLDPNTDTSCAGCFQSYIAGGKLKSTGTQYWLSPNASASNSSGFSGLPGGFRYDDGSYSSKGEIGAWWSASPNDADPDFAFSRELFNYDGEVYWNYTFINRGLSVRCIKDAPSNLPSVITLPVTNITESGADCVGTVSSTGISSVTQRGLCWSLAPNPTTNDFRAPNGSGPGTFLSSITGLEPNSTYYVRAYATNSAGTTYGNQISFTTAIGLPVISTIPVSSITITNAVCGGFISSNGGATITQRGVCWGVNSSPTLANNYSLDGTGDYGSFTSTVSGLIQNTAYYIRAYAVNSAGVSYGNQIVFTTAGPTQIGIDSLRIMFNNGISTVPSGRFIRGIIISDFVNANIVSRNMVVQDGSSGITVRFAVDHTFPLGSIVEMDISGQPMASYNGVLQLGGAISLSSCLVVGAGSVSPRVVTISDIYSNHEAWESTLIRLQNTIITNSAGPNYGSGTPPYCTLSDGSGFSIALYTYPLSSFSATPYPLGPVSVTGILGEYSPTSFNPQIYLRNTSDVQ